MLDVSRSNRQEPNRSKPIFILGITQRSGTNFLFDLLVQHPECGAPEPIWEDYFVSQIDLLDDYLHSVSGCWNPRWNVDDDGLNRLRRHIGSGIVAFLQEQSEKRQVVTKTPNVRNLQRFFDYFPNAYLLILVRDGRAVVESGIKSFDWHRDAAIHKWVDAARTIESYVASHSGDQPRGHFLVVRYEDLWLNLKEELTRILEFLGLPTDSYDFSSAANLPVRGSSTVRQNRSQGVNWKPVEKSSTFDPMSRFRHWGRSKHERFNWIAGKQLKAFGYDEKRFSSARTLWSTWNVMRDGGWVVVRTLGPIYLKWKRYLRGRPSSKKPRPV